MTILLVWIVCVIATAILAANKGRSVGGWLLLAILLGPLAVLLAAVVSNRSIERQAGEATAARAAEEACLRRCPFCAERIQRQAIICRFCGKDVPPIVEEAIYIESPRATSAEDSTNPESDDRGWLWIGVFVVVAVLCIGMFLKTTLTTKPTPASEDAQATAELERQRAAEAATATQDRAAHGIASTRFAAARQRCMATAPPSDQSLCNTLTAEDVIRSEKLARQRSQ